MYCEKCRNNTDNDAVYCPYCGAQMNEGEIVQNEDIKDVSYKLKIAGLLIIFIGIIGVVDTIGFRLIWGGSWNQFIYESWYQLIYIFLYIIGMVYGHKLTKREDWTISLVLVLIYIIHFAGIFIEKNIKPPVIIPYIIPMLSFIVLTLLLITRREYEENILNKDEKDEKT